MLIPIGFLGAGGASGAYELISTSNGTGSSGVITFSSIPSTYKHLQIRWSARSSFAGATSVFITFNGDSAANYSWHRLYGDGSGVYSDATANASYALANNIPGTTAPTGSHGSSVHEILDYASSSKNKTIRLFGGMSDSSLTNISLRSSAWRNTSAVTSITLTCGSSANFTSTSRFSLYGIKG